jgi:hypothetical protein
MRLMLCRKPDYHEVMELEEWGKWFNIPVNGLNDEPKVAAELTAASMTRIKEQTLTPEFRMHETSKDGAEQQLVVVEWLRKQLRTCCDITQHPHDPLRVWVVGRANSVHSVVGWVTVTKVTTLIWGEKNIHNGTVCVHLDPHDIHVFDEPVVITQPIAASEHGLKVYLANGGDKDSWLRVLQNAVRTSPAAMKLLQGDEHKDEETA